ncbi:U3 small nucleolar RNA-interacting protein [Thraustotheca clavata]|uniref:U3 small nucleolar RNA-interacting protein n=1 Tax=Thraustotheca clavata TaxID=74557 RepID=A0A1W0A6H7_9STRA|nr:U3 small nucleolar RNA-interacting protein [Thraustotheca clavata]
MKRATVRGKKSSTKAAPPAKKTKVNDAAFDWGDNIASDAEDSEDETKNASESDEDPYANETADETRVRLAKAYLGKLKDTMDEDDDDTDGEQDKRVSSILEQDVQEASGKLFKKIAENFTEFEFDEESSKYLQGHKSPVTAVCAAEDGKTIYSASKDGTIFKWTLSSEGITKARMELPKDKEAKKLPDHKKTVLALAVSTDNKFVASGGVDKLLHVWDGETSALLESFSGHRDAISCLAFRKRSHMLFSGSFDRTVKHWNLTEMGYVETLFGHQNEITGIDSLQKDRVVTVGRDSSVRLWKIPEETQLVFQGTGSIDCIAMVTDEYYVTGDDTGSVSLWFTGKKKAAFVERGAHSNKWISAIAVLPRTDLVATGSSDGFVRLWRANLQARKLESVAAIPVPGFVNSLAFPKDGRYLVAGIGKEHRLGRWEVQKQAKNGVVIIALPSVDEE